MRTREGMAVARAKGKLRGKQPKLSARAACWCARAIVLASGTAMDVPLVSPWRHQRHIHAPAAQPVGAAIGSMPSRSDFLTRIITSAMITARTEIPAATRYPRPNP